MRARVTRPVRILQARRIGGRVVRVFFDDGLVADIRLPSKPTRVRILLDGFGLKWGGPMQESGVTMLRQMPRTASWELR